MSSVASGAARALSSGASAMAMAIWGYPKCLVYSGKSQKLMMTGGGSVSGNQHISGFYSGELMMIDGDLWRFICDSWWFICD